ncbi:J domain-containing protein [Nannocystis pusilla]|uniref:J domain-containing protein n=1 Tax=Nannocystis pusilla TaxID=889268 RepID=UPI003DA4ADE7
MHPATAVALQGAASGFGPSSPAQHGLWAAAPPSWPAGDPVARWLAACRCVGGRWSVRLDLRGGPRVSDDLDLARDEQDRLLDLWARRDQIGHFERLGLAPTGDDAAIRRAWLETCRHLHPDRYYGKRLGAFAAILAELFDRARASAEFLADPRRRGRYLTELELAGRGAGAR